jgi:predicted regulator of amino acid metabolism with ACT domain
MDEGNLELQIQLAKRCAGNEIQQFLYAHQAEVLLALLENPQFTEKEALLLLNRIDLPSSVIKGLAANRQLTSSHPIRLALLRNPRTPTHISMPLVKFLYPFELMAICMLPAVPSEVKQSAESLLVSQIPKLALGQKINLAKRGPANVVRHFLNDESSRIIQEVLNNPYMTEEILLQVLCRPTCPQTLVTSIATHPKWSLRYNLRLSLVRHPKISLAIALKFLLELKTSDLIEVSNDPRANPEIRRYLQNRFKHQL